MNELPNKLCPLRWWWWFLSLPLGAGRLDSDGRGLRWGLGLCVELESGWGRRQPQSSLPLDNDSYSLLR